MTHVGSSPRVRGKPADRALSGKWSGLIPARAGKTRLAPRRRPPQRAHPRACGENAMHACARATAAGSSPRVRGKHQPRHRHHQHRRLIPARAGKTASRAAGSMWGPAHPRACGENPGSSIVRVRTRGSSPRVRGKRHERSRQRDAVGLIPARAGKTPSWSCSTKRSRAHPRACGENSAQGDARRVRWGSSPRVRGKLARDLVHGRAHGLIPARAGKT